MVQYKVRAMVRDRVRVRVRVCHGERHSRNGVSTYSDDSRVIISSQGDRWIRERFRVMVRVRVRDRVTVGAEGSRISQSSSNWGLSKLP